MSKFVPLYFSNLYIDDYCTSAEPQILPAEHQLTNGGQACCIHTHEHRNVMNMYGWSWKAIAAIGTETELSDIRECEMRDGVNYSDTFGNRDGYSEPYTAGYGDGGKGG